MPFYEKPFKTEEQIIQLLEDKGLRFIDKNLANQTLKNINYYRFKIYIHALKNSDNKYNGSFEEALELYRFDEELRLLLFKYISRIEIKLRSKLDQFVMKHTKDPFWYLEDKFFRIKVNEVRNKLDRNFENSDHEFAKNFK